jgi:hypothetical protein
VENSLWTCCKADYRMNEFFGCSRHNPHCVETKISLTHSQEPATLPNPKRQKNPPPTPSYTHCFTAGNFTNKLRYPKWCHPMRFSDKTFVFASDEKNIFNKYLCCSSQSWSGESISSRYEISGRRRALSLVY